MLLKDIKTKIIVTKDGSKQEVRMTDEDIAAERAKKASSKPKTGKAGDKISGPSE